ncbi:MAG TPA: SRPBCC domain-containing protein [Nitrospirota bacterium]|nr:SRPBCC domain-containing protein [Nitrospirota bacterium]
MATAIKHKKKELAITRIFDAPREKVWKAWTDPEAVKQWWGPKDFTAPHIKIDLRVGGRFVYCMRGAGPDGAVKDYWNIGEHKEIAPLKKIVTTMSFADEQGRPVPASHYGLPGKWPKEVLLTVTFADIKGGKTKLTVQETGIPREVAKLSRPGWEQQLDKLADVLVLLSGRTQFTIEPGKQEIVIKRIYDAPRALVFKAYIDPALIPQWWGPRRYATIVDKLEARPGGLWRFLNRDSYGNDYAFHGVYHELAAPERIVATFEFEGVLGHVSLETLTLEESGGRTILTNRSVFQSVADRDGMLQGGMEEGASETMDRLAELLEKAVSERKAA